MEGDPLAPLLHHFNARAQLFFTGNLCSQAAFGDHAGVGYLHLLRSGKARLRDASGYASELEEPTLIFYARPLSHWFDGDPEVGADLACASVHFEHRSFNPIALALPARFESPLARLPASERLHALLFAEAFDDRPARQEVLNRLFELVLIELLRTALIADPTSSGLLRGLGHERIGRVLAAVHAEPARAWPLEDLATIAGLSRTAFAAEFRQVVGETPGDYLVRWRVSVAQALLRRGKPVKQVCDEVGYASPQGLIKAFHAVLGVSPSTWLRVSRAR